MLLVCCVDLSRSFSPAGFHALQSAPRRCMFLYLICIILELLLHVLNCCLFFCSRLVEYLSVYLWWGFVTHSALFSLCPFLVVLFLIFDLVLLHVVFVALVCGCMWAHHSFCLASVCVVWYCLIAFFCSVGFYCLFLRG